MTDYPHPARLGKYVIRREVGRGSMGVVFEAFDPVIERRVAVKMIRRDEFGATQGDELVARLRREAQAAGRLSHPGIVAIYDFGEDRAEDGQAVAFIAMEFVEGRELREVLDEGKRYTPQESVRIMGAVLAALAHAHERGVTHRDVKPANVILLPDGGVKLADFGVARLESSELTQAGTIIGTPMYMSPEQILGLPVDGRSDLFSCGVMLYELLTGTKPFQGSVTTVIHQVLQVEPPPPSQSQASLGAHWDALMRQALAKKPEQRFADARAMAEAILATAAENAAEDADATVLLMPASPAKAAPGARTLPPVATSPPPPAAPPAAPNPAPRAVSTARAPRSVMPWVLGAIVVGGSALVAAMLWRSSTPKLPTLASTAEPPSLPAPPPAPPGATLDAGAPPVREPIKEAASAPPGAASTPLVVASASAVLAKAPEPASPAPKAAPPAPKVAIAPDWSALLDPARFEAAPMPASLSAALRRVVEPFDARGIDKLQEFDGLLAQQPTPFAYALGVTQGRLVHAWATAADANAAATAARRRCTERLGGACQTVLVDGAFRRRAFFDVARNLGAQPPKAVRAAWLQSVDEAMTELRREADARQKEREREREREREKAAEAARAAQAERRAAAGAVAAAAASAAATPAAEWTRARARLRDQKPADLAGGFAALLDVEPGADRGRIDRFQSEVKRLRWKSALALGVGSNGHLIWTFSEGEPRDEWAEERALSACAPRSRGGCAIVAVNGSFRPTALQTVAERLGARPVAEVRDGFVKGLPSRFR